MPKLILRLGDKVIKEFLLGRGAMTIGRKDDNDIQIESKEVSGLHAKLFNYGGNFFIKDMQSLNGTYVNSKRITKHHLKKGDFITICQYTLDFSHDSEVSEEVQNKQPEAESIVSEEPEIEKVHGEAEIQESVKEEAHGDSEITAGLKILSSKKQTVYTLKKQITTIGVGKDVDIKLKRSIYDPLFVSKIFAIINKKVNGYLITPSIMKSVKINDNFLEKPHLLQDGDIIEYSGAKLQFYLIEK